MTDSPELRPWSALPPEEQRDLRIAFGHAMDRSTQSRVCDMDEKNRLFAEFLARNGVRWPDDPA